MERASEVLAKLPGAREAVLMDLDFDFEEGIESKDQKKAESLKVGSF